MMEKTKSNDEELYEIVLGEYKRQETNIEMIASESTVPKEVLELSGSIFTNKTLEGYPGNRFQAGSEYADKMELLAVERLKTLYKAEHANIQPVSGSTANYSVYAAVLSPGDTILAMDLNHGGHLTHGSSANAMTKFYDFKHYGINKDTEKIDYEQLEQLALQHKPKLIISGASSYPRLIDYEKISQIAKKVGAYTMADIAHVSGLIAAGLIPSPVPHTDFITSSTTKTLCGPRGGFVLTKKEHAKAIDRGVFPRTLGSIHLHTMAGKAFTFKHADTDEFRSTMQSVISNSTQLAASLEEHGFRIVSGGTDNHIIMVDLTPIGITGDQLQKALDTVGITVNKNMIPFDTEKPSVTSGVRIGTTAVSQRGLKEEEMKEIAGIINSVARNHDDKNILHDNKKRVEKLISNFPLYDN